MHVEGCEERIVPLFLYIALPIVPILQRKGEQNVGYFGPQWFSPWPPSGRLLFFNIFFLTLCYALYQQHSSYGDIRTFSDLDDVHGYI